MCVVACGCTARNGCATKTEAQLIPLSDLIEAVRAAAKEFEEAEIAENLELLADFVADVGILGVKLEKVLFERVDFGQIEFRFVQGADNVQHIQRPAASFEFQGSEWFQAAIRAPNFRRGDRTIFLHDGNSSVKGNTVEEDVATYPTGAARGGCKWLPLLQRRFGECKVWDAEQIMNKHGVKAIGHEKEVRGVVMKDCVTHF